MSFDMNPTDEDPHGECRHEIHRLQTENERLNRQVEACRRYFDHCIRISLSARGAKTGSGEVNVRMALKAEAQEALGLIGQQQPSGDE